MKLNRKHDNITYSKVKMASRHFVLVRGGDGGGKEKGRTRSQCKIHFIIFISQRSKLFEKHCLL